MDKKHSPSCTALSLWSLSQSIQITPFLNFSFVRRLGTSIKFRPPFPPLERNLRPFDKRLEDWDSRNDPADGEISTPAGISTPHSPVVQPTIITVHAAVLKSLELTVTTADSSTESVFAKIRAAYGSLAKLYLVFCGLVFMHHRPYHPLCIHSAWFRYYSHSRKFKN